jgi:predicted solute-binding protein
MYRLGVVSFLNARPLIAGLDGDARLELRFDVPARLAAMLDAGSVDAALIPIIDVLRSGGRYRVLSDACIGCDGETMTVRVFSQIPPDRLRTLWVDGDSHTSVALARVLWRELYGRDVELLALDTRRQPFGDFESVLLIGDKVVDPARGSFAYEVDLGGAWRQHTRLPFVFAVWATLNSEAARPRSHEATEPRSKGAMTRRSDEGKVASGRRGGRSRRTGHTEGEIVDLATRLSRARDLGLVQADDIAKTAGPELGWPVELARRYLTRCLKYKLDARSIAGVELFARLCAAADIVPADAEIAWPDDLRSCAKASTADRAYTVR